MFVLLHMRSESVGVTELCMMTDEGHEASGSAVQRIFVMRHGEREDSRNPQWKKTAVRPYDTPITSRGGREVHRLSKARFSSKDIHIIYSSPFLRCLQTATQASLALEIEGVRLSKYLSEILAKECSISGTPDVPCEDISSYGVTITHPDHRDFPSYPEKATEAILRYKEEFKRLADVHWPDNLLLVTHEYGVLAGIELGGTTEPMEATYCGCVELIRTDHTQHNWTIGQCHGVYKYDTIE